MQRKKKRSSLLRELSRTLRKFILFVCTESTAKRVYDTNFNGIFVLLSKFFFRLFFLCCFFFSFLLLLFRLFESELAKPHVTCSAVDVDVFALRAFAIVELEFSVHSLSACVRHLFGCVCPLFLRRTNQTVLLTHSIVLLLVPVQFNEWCECIRSLVDDIICVW